MKNSGGNLSSTCKPLSFSVPKLPAHIAQRAAYTIICVRSIGVHNWRKINAHVFGHLQFAVCRSHPALSSSVRMLFTIASKSRPARWETVGSVAASLNKCAWLNNTPTRTRKAPTEKRETARLRHPQLRSRTPLHPACRPQQSSNYQPVDSSIKTHILGRGSSPALGEFERQSGGQHATLQRLGRRAR
jgi:hypothetical protein